MWKSSNKIIMEAVIDFVKEKESPITKLQSEIMSDYRRESFF